MAGWARIVLLRAEGRSQVETAGAVDVNRPVVIRWERSLAKLGLAGLAEAAGRGRKPSIPNAKREKVLVQAELQTLNVSDLDRSVAFYRDMAGLELVEQNATGEAFLTSTSPSGARSQMSSKAIFEAPRYSSSPGPPGERLANTKPR